MKDDLEQLLGVGSRVRHPEYGDGVIVKLHPVAYQVCFIADGLKEIGKKYDNWEIIERIEPEDSVTFSKFEHSLTKILKKWSGISEIIEIGSRWKGGTLILKPNEAHLKSKEVSIDTFFHKIVMVRDRLRVLEQRINSSKSLTSDEKINLQQYITRIYGSLTTFNVLFAHREDTFKGEGRRKL